MKKMLGNFYINFAKILAIFCCTIFAAFSPSSYNAKVDIYINSIDSTTLKNNYLIHFSSKKTNGIIYSKKTADNLVNCKQIASGQSYILTINEVFKITIDDATFPLYIMDIYIDYTLVLNKHIRVFESNELYGLCIRYP